MAGRGVDLTDDGVTMLLLFLLWFVTRLRFRAAERRIESLEDRLAALQLDHDALLIWLGHLGQDEPGAPRMMS